ARAIESARVDAVLHDPLATLLLQGSSKSQELQERLSQALPNMDAAFGPRHSMIASIRAHAIGQRLEKLLYLLHTSEAGGQQNGRISQQVVCLGAGLDTRPWRMLFPPQTAVFEVDVANVLSFKQRKLHDAGAAVTVHEQSCSFPLKCAEYTAIVAATIDEEGYFHITGRIKDVIKSGGEWIVPSAIENTVMLHDEVSEAAVIAMPHAKWVERPLLIVKPSANAVISKQEVFAVLKDKVAKWWLPDDVIFVKDLPRTATGKVSKLLLREQFKNHALLTV
ncbi:TPA: hypothetical protein ACH3X1_014334, partial [Trebouxia sp. C0004]